MAPQPHSFLLHLVQSGEFSDFTLLCKDREFKLHQMIVCPQSPVITAALRGGFEVHYKLAPKPEKRPAQHDHDEKREEGEVIRVEKSIY
ncbi:Uncharacterized protein HZ326_13030 [Fusarium oxysporum f. sp. albedinis]|nr:Uncharacterized protein HZ326_13030 [Fusarium oxysporum f. sp. albedinis]